MGLCPFEKIKCTAFDRPPIHPWWPALCSNAPDGIQQHRVRQDAGQRHRVGERVVDHVLGTRAGSGVSIDLVQQGVDAGINALLDQVNGDARTRAGAQNVIDYAFANPVTLSGILADPVLLDAIWGV